MIVEFIANNIQLLLYGYNELLRLVVIVTVIITVCSTKYPYNRSITVSFFSTKLHFSIEIIAKKVCSNLLIVSFFARPYLLHSSTCIYDVIHVY